MDMAYDRHMRQKHTGGGGGRQTFRINGSTVSLTPCRSARSFICARTAITAPISTWAQAARGIGVSIFREHAP